MRPNKGWSVVSCDIVHFRVKWCASNEEYANGGRLLLGGFLAYIIKAGPPLLRAFEMFPPLVCLDAASGPLRCLKSPLHMFIQPRGVPASPTTPNHSLKLDERTG